MPPEGGEYELIDEVTELGNSYKWKIAFLYSEEKLIPYYKKKYLLSLSNALGGEFKKSTPTSEIQRFLISQQKGKNIYDYTAELWQMLSEDDHTDSDSEEEYLEMSKTRYWLYAPGEGASQWQRCLETSSICLGWDPLGDFSSFNSQEEVIEKLRIAYNEPTKSFKNDSLAVWSFLSIIKKGDVIFAKKGTGKIIGRGVVTGDYQFDAKASSHKNIRTVEWEIVGEWDSDHKLVQKTLTDITKYPDFVNKLNLLTSGISNVGWTLSSASIYNKLILFKITWHETGHAIRRACG